MIWKTKTHECTATICMKTGRPCPMAARALKSLTEATQQALDCAQDSFELEGSIALTGCSEGCAAFFHLAGAHVRVFCDVTDQSDARSLNRYAEMLFGEGGSFPSGATTVPAALLQATPRAVAMREDFRTMPETKIQLA